MNFLTCRGRWALILALLLMFRASCAVDIYSEATRGQAREVTPAYFGIHFHRLVLEPHENAIRTQWPNLEFGTVRLWDAVTRWGDIAPKPGIWNFDRLDTYVREIKKHHAQVLYTLGSTPRWASARPDERCSYGLGCSAEPARLAHWQEYVRRVALRYRGQINAYEVWNEPYFADLTQDQSAGFYTGNADTLVDMARIARLIIDQVDPSALLATPGFVGTPEHLDLFLRKGGKHYVQAISYHLYSGNAEGFARRVLEVREVMRRHGVDNLPLWNTEQGIDSYPVGARMPDYLTEHLTRQEAAIRMVQLLILGASAGLERFYYYAWDNERSGMVTFQGKRLPAYDAMERVQKWLIGARTQGCSMPNPGVVVCKIERGNNPELILWAERAGEQIIQLPDGFEVREVEELFPGDMPTANTKSKGNLRLKLSAEPVRVMLRTLDTSGAGATRP